MPDWLARRRTPRPSPTASRAAVERVCQPFAIQGTESLYAVRQDLRDRMWEWAGLVRHRARLAAMLDQLTLTEDVRDAGRQDRLAALVAGDALSACHGHMRGVDVCPMELSPTDAITTLRRRAVASLFGLSLRSQAKGDE